MSTVSNVTPTFNRGKIAADLLETLPTDGQELTARPRVDFGLFRSTRDAIKPVTEEQFILDPQPDQVVQTYKPFTVMHSLRPFLGVGYGHSTMLRGSGVGKGDSTDSGSYSFLRSQAEYVV